MKPQWQEFLVHAGAEFDGGRVASFGNPERELQVATTGRVLCDLSHQGLIGVYGDEAADFLQGQLSNDIREVDENHSQLSAYCDPKGRMLTNFRVFKRGETYFLRLPRELLETVLKRLHMYVLRAKVTLEDASDALVRIGYAGPEAEREIATATGAAPEAANDCLQAGGLTVIRVSGPHPRFEIHGELEALKKIWSVLNAQAAPVGASPWALLEILAGIPTILPQTSGLFVPQMVNMQLIGGVSFKKGCYPGQEIVARMHYLGNLKRRMYRGHLETDTPPEPGEELFSGGKGQASGRIVDAQPHPDGGVEALAVLRIADAEQNELHLGGPDGPRYKLKNLPYKFDIS